MSGWIGIAKPMLLLGVILAGVLLVLVNDPRIFSASKNNNKNNPARQSPSNEGTIHSQNNYPEYSNISGLAPMQEPAELWLWCQLDVKNVNKRLFWHFPHASQALLPCWSWFQKIMGSRNHHLRITASTAHTHCGFYLKDGLGSLLRPEGWIAQLIQLMGCSITETDPSGSISSDKCNGTANCPAINETLVYRLPFDDYHNLTFFKLLEDAAALRSKILRSLNFTENPRASRTAARIAIVNRNRTRRILNLESMRNTIQAAFPNATVETAYMENMKPAEQLVYWSQHDVIVTGHGAAITNALMMPPGNTSAVVEIFPPHYYAAYFFGPLLKSAGIRRYGYFYGVSDYLTDFEEHSKTREDRDKYRGQDLEPPLDDILDLVKLAMLEGGFLSDGRTAPLDKDAHREKV